MATLAIATRHEIAGAGIQALLQTAGHSVVAHCSREDDLLRSLEAYRPDIIILGGEHRQTGGHGNDFATPGPQLLREDHLHAQGARCEHP